MEFQGRRCTNCHYILEGLPTARCPECGLAFDLNDPRTYLDPMRRPDMRVTWQWAALLCVMSMLIVSSPFAACRQLKLIPDPGLATLALITSAGSAAVVRTMFARRPAWVSLCIVAPSCLMIIQQALQYRLWISAIAALAGPLIGIWIARAIVNSRS